MKSSVNWDWKWKVMPVYEKIIICPKGWLLSYGSLLFTLLGLDCKQRHLNLAQSWSLLYQCWWSVLTNFFTSSLQLPMTSLISSLLVLLHLTWHLVELRWKTASAKRRACTTSLWRLQTWRVKTTQGKCAPPASLLWWECRRRSMMPQNGCGLPAATFPLTCWRWAGCLMWIFISPQLNLEGYIIETTSVYTCMCANVSCAGFVQTVSFLSAKPFCKQICFALFDHWIFLLGLFCVCIVWSKTNLCA